MATEVKITAPPQQLTQLSSATVATVQVQFEVLGILPDVVQIYASQVTSEIGQLVDTVDMSPPEFQYMDQIQLQAGSIFNIGFCPRTKTDGTLDDTINDAFWELSCVFVQFTTQSITSPPPSSHPPSPPPPQGYQGGIKNVQAQAKPFGKIVLTWQKNGNFVALLVVQRTQKISDNEESGYTKVFSAPNYAGNDDVSSGGFTDTGPFTRAAEYGYLVSTTAGQDTAYAGPPWTLYPGWFSLKQFLPAGFDPGQGIKRLRPNDHPFVSVREIMTI
jgi:hypothetical protein